MMNKPSEIRREGSSFRPADIKHGRELWMRDPPSLEYLCQQTGNEGVSTCSRIILARSAKELRPGPNRRRARKYEHRPARTVGFT